MLQAQVVFLYSWHKRGTNLPQLKRAPTPTTNAINIQARLTMCSTLFPNVFLFPEVVPKVNFY